MVTETFTAGQDFTVPEGVFSLEVELEGEAGEDSSYTGGDGGRVVGNIVVSPGDVVYIRDSTGGDAEDIPGRGGRSIDIRRGGTTLSDRVAVAAGGGGSGWADVDSIDGSSAGGDGGASTGEGGEPGDSTGGGGGTQTDGGAAGDTTAQDGEFGPGGDGGNAGGIDRDGGGGGGGWYGGGGGGADDDDFGGFAGGGGGGGSNYDDGLGTVTANERGTSTRSHGQGGLVTITYDPVPGAENLQITDTTATSNTLAWDAPTLPPEVDSVDQYRIYRDTDPGTVRADYTEIATTPTPGFEDTGLENGAEYHYRIGADLFVPEAEGTITITGFRGV